MSAIAANPPREHDTTAPAGERALWRALDDLSTAESRGEAGAMADACQRAAQCYRDLGAAPSALPLMERALRWADCSGAPDRALDLRCELAELLAELAEQADREATGLGRVLREQARDQVFDATQSVTGCADPRWEVTLLLRLSDVLDRFGDHDDATALQVRALQLTVAEFYAPAPPRAEHAVPVRRH